MDEPRDVMNILAAIRAKYVPILNHVDRSEYGIMDEAADHENEIMAELTEARRRANAG